MDATPTVETPDRPTVYAVDEYEPQAFDAVLVQEETVVGLQADPPQATVVPLTKVNRVDGDPATVLTGPAIPESFYGGARYGFVDLDAFPDVKEHVEAIDREKY
ncbi:MAG: hypothetical protein R3324_18125 [Halobacteriales archaeon]|nr:hypothetical protein [Halobacteriales archaeon]